MFPGLLRLYVLSRDLHVVSVSSMIGKPFSLHITWDGVKAAGDENLIHVFYNGPKKAMVAPIQVWAERAPSRIIFRKTL